MVLGGGDGEDSEAEDLRVRDGGTVAGMVLRMDEAGDESGRGCNEDEEGCGMHGGGTWW